jgi:hypothetical protein
MTLKVIGAGFGRTGTMSLKLALEQLGFGPCYHMEVVFQTPEHLPVWHKAVDGTLPDWNAFLGAFGSVVDWPTTHFWRELYEASPDAKVILPIRSAESWWESYAATIMQFLQIVLQDPSHPAFSQTELCRKMIGEQCFGTHYQDREAAIAAYHRRTEDVRAHVAPDRLLEYQLGSGWAPICEFLGVPIPARTFPRSNQRDEFFKNFDPTAAMA